MGVVIGEMLQATPGGSSLHHSRLLPSGAAQPDMMPGAGDVIGHMLDYLTRHLAADAATAIEIDLQSHRTVIVGSTGFEFSGVRWDAELAALPHGSQLRQGKADVAVGRWVLPGLRNPVLVFSVPVATQAVILVVVARPEDTGGFKTGDERSATALADWIGGCLRLWHASRSERAQIQSLNAALDLLAVAIMVVDADGNLATANRAARGLLDNGEGLRVSGERLRAAALDDSAKLQTAFAEAAGTSVGSDGLERAAVLFVRRAGRRSLTVAVRRGSWQTSGSHSVIVLAIDPESDIGGPIAPLGGLYGFTAAEIRLLHLLVAGHSLGDAATALNIQPLTARTHLKRMFEKTGTHRQGTLIRLMLTSAVQTASDLVLEVV